MCVPWSSCLVHWISNSVNPVSEALTLQTSSPKHADDCANLLQSTHTPAVSRCIRIDHFLGDKQIHQCSPIKPALESNIPTSSIVLPPAMSVNFFSPYRKLRKMWKLGLKGNSELQKHCVLHLSSQNFQKVWLYEGLHASYLWFSLLWLLHLYCHADLSCTT